MTKQPTLLAAAEVDLDLKSPVFKARPGWGGRLGAWLSHADDSHTLTVIFTGVILLLGLYSYLKINHQRAAVQNITHPASNQQIEQKGQPPQAVPVAAATSTQFSQTAKTGQGVTHLSRGALNQYLRANPGVSLSPEQKIYVEDYLRKNIGPRRLNPGDTIVFSAASVAKGVDKAMLLKPQELANLKKYVR